MPIYKFLCKSCRKSFESLLSITDRNTPLAKPCPECGKKKVEKVVSATVMGVDATKGPGSDFKKITERIAKGVPARYREGLEKSASLRGKKYGAM